MNINDDEPNDYDFGWWPDVFGFFMVLSVIVFLFSMSDGML